MSIGLLFLIGLSAELLFLSASMVRMLRERRALLAFSLEMSKALKGTGAPSRDRASERLRGEAREAVEELEQSLRAGRSMDEALTEAITTIADARLRGNAMLAFLLDGMLVLAALGPILAALARSASRLAELAGLLQGLKGPRLYAQGFEAIPRSFGELRSGFEASAVLCGGLALAFALRWWMLRPEVREARVLESMLRGAVAAKPGVPAPIGAGLARLLAPDLSLAAAVKATLAFAALVLGSWGLLTGLADLRHANSAPMRMTETWNADRYIATQADAVALPAHPGGEQLEPGPSMILSAHGMQIASTEEVPLEDGGLPKDWPQRVKALDPTIASLRQPGKPLSMSVLVHKELPMERVVPVLRAVRTAFGVARYQLVTVRAIDGHEKHPIQAGLELVISGPEDPKTPLTLKIGAEELEVISSGASPAHISFRLESWPEALRQVVRTHTGILGKKDEPDLRVAVDPAAGVLYDRLVEVLSAADAMCETTRDCGLPGLGLRFTLVQSDPAK